MLINFLKSSHAINKLVDNQLMPALACELGHPAGVHTNIQIPPSFFPIFFLFLKIGTQLEHIWCKTPVS